MTDTELGELMDKVTQFTEKHKMNPDDMLHAVASAFDITILGLEWDTETEEQWIASGRAASAMKYPIQADVKDLNAEHLDRLLQVFATNKGS